MEGTGGGGHKALRVFLLISEQVFERKEWNLCHELKFSYPLQPNGVILSYQQNSKF